MSVDWYCTGWRNHGGRFARAMGLSAEEWQALPQAALALASAIPVKAPSGITTSRPAVYRAWGSAFGGAESVNGDADVGSHTTTSRVFGFAAGINDLIAPTIMLCFALAGGGTNWGLDDWTAASAAAPTCSRLSPRSTPPDARTTRFVPERPTPLPRLTGHAPGSPPRATMRRRAVAGGRSFVGARPSGRARASASTFAEVPHSAAALRSIAMAVAVGVSADGQATA